MVDYIKVKEAAEYLGVTPQLVYKQIRRYVIKSKKIGGITYTTKEWLNDYEALKDTHHHALYKNRPVNNPEKGEYSVAHCAEILGIDRMIILSRITRGKIAAIRKGGYYIVPKAEFEKLQAEIESKQLKLMG